MAKREKGAAGMALTRRQNITLHYRANQLEDQLEDANDTILSLKEENEKLKRRVAFLEKHAFPNRIKVE